MSNDWKMQAAREIQRFIVSAAARAGFKGAEVYRDSPELAAIIARHAPPVEELVEAARDGLSAICGVYCSNTYHVERCSRLRSALSHWDKTDV